RFIRENLLVEVQRTFHIEMERNATARQLFTMMLSERIAQELVQLRLSQDELTRLLNGLGSMPAQLAAIQRSLAALERERNSSSVAAVPLVGAIDSEGDENENTIENEGEPPSVVTQRGSFGSIHSRGNRNRNRVINRRTPAPSADDRTTILALFADPLPRNKPLDLMREQRQLQRGLAEFPDAFRLEVVASATIDDLTRQLLALQPTVIHLGGHGSVTGFYFSDEAGNRCMIQWAHLSEELRAHSPPLQVVVLSACYGLEGLGQLDVPWLVAMPGPLYDEASIAFARGFYQSLNANSGAIRAAYDAGRRAAHRAGFVDAELPQLFADGELL
ncbi:MAG: hypothetical protein KDD73_17245, partial [Anaerolineales bacterium]|nr:hypothetical protein [Anaerolineales bacterium]